MSWVKTMSFVLAPGMPCHVFYREVSLDFDIKRNSSSEREMVLH